MKVQARYTIITVNFRQPQTPEEWSSYYDLRFRILREPWGAERGSEVDATDGESYNLMAVDDDARLLAVARLHLNSPEQSQVRYMAVDAAHQSQGTGSQLLHALEAQAQHMGATEMMLEARETALEFYKKNGYTIQKTSYLLFGQIQHYTMTKKLES